MTSPRQTVPNRYGQSLMNFLLVVSGLCLLVMMAIITVDVVGRYIFSRSLTGATELVSVALAVAVSLSLPAVTWGQSHIALGLFQGPSSSLIERIRVAFVSLISAVTMAIVALVLWQRGLETIKYEDVIGYLELPVAPMVFVLSVMSGLTAVVFLLLALRWIPDGADSQGFTEPAPANTHDKPEETQ